MTFNGVVDLISFACELSDLLFLRITELVYYVAVTGFQC